MSLMLKKVSKIDKLIFLEFNAVNILIYCNNKEGIEPLYTEINKLVNKEVLFNNFLDLVDNHVKKKVVLNKKDIEIIQKNAKSNLNFSSPFTNNEKVGKYILISS